MNVILEEILGKSRSQKIDFKKRIFMKSQRMTTILQGFRPPRESCKRVLLYYRFFNRHNSDASKSCANDKGGNENKDGRT